MAKPTMNLDTISITGEKDKAHIIEPIKNITAVTKIIFCLPNISVNLPFVIAPIEAPKRTVETKNPCIKWDISHS